MKPTEPDTVVAPAVAGAASAWGARGLCLSAALLWSTSGLFMKPLTRAVELPAGWGAAGHAWPGLEVAGLRSLIAFPLLLILSGKRRLPRGGELVVAACMAVTMITYSLAQAYTATANAILLQYAAPLYILALSPALLGERPHLRDLLAAPVIVAGMALIFASGGLGRGTHFGNAMGALSGFSYAGVVLCLRKWPGSGGIAGLAWGNAIAAAVSLPLAPVLEGPLVVPSVTGWAMILWLGLVQIGVAYFLFERSTRRLRAVEASLIAMVEPVACPFWSFLALGERPAGLAVAGGAAIVLTLVAHTLAAPRGAGLSARRHAGPQAESRRT